MKLEHILLPTALALLPLAQAQETEIISNSVKETPLISSDDGVFHLDQIEIVKDGLTTTILRYTIFGVGSVAYHEYYDIDEVGAPGSIEMYTIPIPNEESEFDYTHINYIRHGNEDQPYFKVLCSMKDTQCFSDFSFQGSLDLAENTLDILRMKYMGDTT